MTLKTVRVENKVFKSINLYPIDFKTISINLGMRCNFFDTRSYTQ